MNLAHWILVAVLCLTFGCDASTSHVVEQAPETTGVQLDRLQRPLPTLERVDRIVSLSPSTTELLFALDLGDRIVGATKHCDYPAEALDIPRMGGGTMESLSTEAIVATKPDLVLCQYDSHAPLIESLDRIGIQTLAIGPQSIEELFDEARWIGRLTGRVEQAEALISQMELRLSQLTRRAADQAAGKRTKVFYEVWDAPLMTAGAGSFIDQLMQFAQFENITGDIPTRYPRISAETVINKNPEVILAPTTHFEIVDVQAFATRPGWGGIAAIKNQRVYLIDGDEVSRCGPRMLNALEQMLDAVYGSPVESEPPP